MSLSKTNELGSRNGHKKKEHRHNRKKYGNEGADGTPDDAKRALIPPVSRLAEIGTCCEAVEN